MDAAGQVELISRLKPNRIRDQNAEFKETGSTRSHFHTALLFARFSGPFDLHKFGSNPGNREQTSHLHRDAAISFPG